MVTYFVTWIPQIQTLYQLPKKGLIEVLKLFYAQALMSNKLEIDLPVLCRPLAGTV